MDIWYIKPSASGTYVRQPSPSSYSGECEDLDANSYRSKTTGNLNDNVISTRWRKLKQIQFMLNVYIQYFQADILKLSLDVLSFHGIY